MTKAEFKALSLEDQIQTAAEQESFWRRTKGRLNEKDRVRTNEERTAINQEIVADVDSMDLVS